MGKQPQLPGSRAKDVMCKRWDTPKDTLEKGFAIPKQLHVGGFILEIDGDRPVFAGLASGVAHGSSSGQMVDANDDPRWG